jgi:hypothetical protein
MLNDETHFEFIAGDQSEVYYTLPIEMNFRLEQSLFMDPFIRTGHAHFDTYYYKGTPVKLAYAPEINVLYIKDDYET